MTDTYLYKKNIAIPDNNYLLMAFPERKSFALSSLGYLWLYKIASTQEGINTEMLCTDYMTDISLKKTTAVSFSMSFDFDFMGVFEILDKLKIPILAKQRKENMPLIFAGGAVITTNPEPYKEFFDFMIIGDGESVLSKILDIIKSNYDKNTALEMLAEIEGVYVPKINKKVKKLTEPLNKVIYTPIVSDESYFQNTFIIEISRGCMNRCAFCTASYANLPFRHNNYEKIIEAIELGLNKTNKIALLGAQISAHPEFSNIIKYLKNKMDKGANIELGISSLRADSITPELIQTLVQGGQKTSTIAIEAASERLRKFINKNLTDEQIFNAIKISRENGLSGMKIYSMIGIPNETQEDIEQFVILGKKLKDENKGFDITFSFSSFVPKPHTPFQWALKEDIKSVEKKQKYLEKELAKIGIKSKFSSAKWDFWQTVLSRGGSELAPLLTEVYKNGGKSSAYKSAFKDLNLNYDLYINEIPKDRILPWDYIENLTDKEFLSKEYNRLTNKL